LTRACLREDVFYRFAVRGLKKVRGGFEKENVVKMKKNLLASLQVQEGLKI
jgi:hypothetical protein